MDFLTTEFKYHLTSTFFIKKVIIVNSKTFVVVDIETTGLSPHYHKMTEIAAVKMRNHKVIDEFSTLINPECLIPRFITKLTGIDNELVKDAPRVGKVMPHFKEFLGENPFVAHNAWFDYGFLDKASRSHTGKFLSNDVLCTCKLARRLLPDLPKKKLGYVCDHFNIDNLQAHRSMGDAKATAQVFSNFINMLEAQGLKSYEDLLNFQTSRIKRQNYG